MEGPWKCSVLQRRRKESIVGPDLLPSTSYMQALNWISALVAVTIELTNSNRCIPVADSTASLTHATVIQSLERRGFDYYFIEYGYRMCSNLKFSLMNVEKNEKWNYDLSDYTSRWNWRNSIQFIRKLEPWFITDLRQKLRDWGKSSSKWSVISLHLY